MLLALSEIDLRRLAIILALAVGAHASVVLVRILSQWLIGTGIGSISKARTLTRFLASTAAFVIWFVAIGFALLELNVPLQTYLASATIIGLAVSFGAQSLVQDIISGLTLIFGGLIDVGDMVEISGQTGVVEKIGIRYTELRNMQGAVVSIPNRNVTNVINFPKGYIHAFLDVRVAPEHEDAATMQVERIAEAAFHQFSGIMIRPPSIMHHKEPTGDKAFIRVKFRIWPGQGAAIESAIRQRIVHNMRRIDPEYLDSMTAVHYRVEPAFTRRAVSALEALRRRKRSVADSDQPERN